MYLLFLKEHFPLHLSLPLSFFQSVNDVWILCLSPHYKVLAL